MPLTVTEMCDELREQAVNNLFSMSSFSTSWNSKWKNDLVSLITTLGGNGKALIDLGDHLSGVFLSTKGSGRGGGGAKGQSSLAGGGASWEGLVTWYLNLILAGTRAVAIKSSKKLIPQPFFDAIRVTYGTHATNTESDILVLIFPNEKNVQIPSSLSSADSMASYLAKNEFSMCSMGVIQCKTNWNDNAQIPMLWDMLYSADTFRNTRIAVGTTSYNIQSLKGFTYSFVTVPTSRGPYKQNSTSVLRVNNLTGGNYWGQNTLQSVAFSVKEIFNKNYSMNNVNFLLNANNTFTLLKHKYSYFDL